MDELNKTKQDEEEEEEEEDDHEEHGRECKCGCQDDTDSKESSKHECGCHCHTVPDELKSWNWGAFLLSWVWAIGNNVWVGLLAFLPYLWLPIAILLGAKGNEWAWEAGHYTNLEDFQKRQKGWKKAGFIVLAAIGCFYLSLFFWAATLAGSIFWGLLSLFITGR